MCCVTEDSLENIPKMVIDPHDCCTLTADVVLNFIESINNIKSTRTAFLLLHSNESETPKLNGQKKTTIK